MRVPTEKQYKLLQRLGSGAALIIGTKRDVEPLLRREWVTAEKYPTATDRYYSWIRITPNGLRALANAVERYGLPELRP